jgi:UDP-N-acetylmuramate dehydrogenase
MKILENVSLAELTTFKIGGPARYFCAITNVEELKEALDFAKSPAHSLPIFILGGGSNILVSDKGFAGLVIKMEIRGTDVAGGKKEFAKKNGGEKADKKNEDETSQFVEITAGAGEIWDDLVAFTVRRGLGGLENLSLIPGTVGAAPVQNIGAYGAEVKDTISAVEVFNIETGEVRNMKNAECRFSYRDSIFKKPEGKKYIITRVTFRLSKKLALKTDYKDVANYLKTQQISLGELDLKKVREIVIAIRRAKLPDVSKSSQNKIGTAGSFFKNPIVSGAKYQELKKLYPDMPHFLPNPSRSQNGQEKVKIPAAWLLDKLCGFKGYRDESVGVYENQALVLVNFGGASAANVMTLAKKMADDVFEKTGIKLEREVRVVR